MTSVAGVVALSPSSSAASVNLRALIATKQHELAVITTHHQHEVQAENQQLKEALAHLHQRYAAIKGDFEYNLELVAARDAELSRYDELGVTYARTLEQKQTEFLTQLRASEARLDSQNMQLAEITDAHAQLRQTASQLQEQLASQAWSHEAELRALKHNAATAMREAEAKLAAKDEQSSKGQYELMHNFERATEQNAAEAQERLDKANAQIKQLTATIEQQTKELQRAAEKLAVEQHRRTLVEQRLEETDAKLIASESSESELRAKLAQQEASHAATVADLNSAHEALVKRCVTDYKALANTLDKVQLQCVAQTETHREETDKMRREAERSQGEVASSYQRQLHTSQQELQLTQQQLRDSQTLAQTVQSELDTYVAAEQARTATLNSDLAQFQSSHSKQLQDLNLSLWKGEEERKALSDKNETLKKSIDDRRQEIAATKEALTAAERQCEEFERRATGQRLTADREQAEAEDTIAGLRIQLKAAMDAQKRVQADRDAQESHHAHTQNIIAEYQHQLKSARAELLHLHSQEHAAIEKRASSAAVPPVPVLTPRGGLESPQSQSGVLRPRSRTQSHPSLDDDSSVRSGNLSRISESSDFPEHDESSHQLPHGGRQLQFPQQQSQQQQQPQSQAHQRSVSEPATRPKITALSLNIASDEHQALEVETDLPSARTAQMQAARKQSHTSPNINLNPGQASLESFGMATHSRNNNVDESNSDDDFVEQPLSDSSLDNSTGGYQRSPPKAQRARRAIHVMPIHETIEEHMSAEMVGGSQSSTLQLPLNSPRPYTPAFSEDMGPVSLPNSMPNSPMGARPSSGGTLQQRQQQLQQHQQQHRSQHQQPQSHQQPQPDQHHEDFESESYNNRALSDSHHSTHSTTSRTSSHVALEHNAGQLKRENATLQQQNASLSNIIREMKHELENFITEQQTADAAQAELQQQQPPFYPVNAFYGPPYPSREPVADAASSGDDTADTTDFSSPEQPRQPRRDGMPFHASDRATSSQLAVSRALRLRAELLRKKDAEVKARADAARARVREQMKRMRAIEVERQREASGVDDVPQRDEVKEQENNPWKANDAKPPRARSATRVTISTTLRGRK